MTVAAATPTVQQETPDTGGVNMPPAGTASPGTPDGSAPATPAGSATGAESSVPPDQKQQTQAPAYAPGSTVSSSMGPGTGPARVAPNKLPQRGGMLAGILTGALKGAETAAKTAGKGALAVAKSTAIGQRLQDQNLQRAAVKQQMGQEKQKALDEHQESVLRANKMTLDNISQAQKNYQDKISDENLNETNRLTIQGLRDQRNAAVRDMVSTIESIDPRIVDSVHFAPGAPAQYLTADHGTDAGNGDIIGIQNGQTGDDADIYWLDNSKLQGTPLPYDEKVAVDYNFNPKTGDMTPVYQTLTAGKQNLLDLVTAVQGGIKKYNMFMDMYAKQLANEQVVAGTKEKETGAEKDIAEANKANADAKLTISLAGGGGGNEKLEGQAFLDSIPPGTIKDDVLGVIRYEMDPQTLGRGQQRALVVADAIHATGGKWSMGQYKERYDYVQQYGSGDKGEGAQRDRMNTAIGHLDLLNQASQALPSNSLQVLNRIANTIGVQTGNNAQVVYAGIAQKAAAEAAAATKGGGSSPTDEDIKAQVSLFNASQSLSQRTSNIRSQMQLIKTTAGTIHDHFTNVMGVTPEDFGQPVLFGQNQAIVDKWTNGPATGPSAGNQPGQIPNWVPQGATSVHRNASDPTVIGWVQNGVYHAGPTK